VKVKILDLNLNFLTRVMPTCFYFVCSNLSYFYVTYPTFLTYFRKCLVYISNSGSRKSRLTAVGICCADHATPSIRKMLALTSPTCGDRSVGLVRLRTEATEFCSLYAQLEILRFHNFHLTFFIYVCTLHHMNVSLKFLPSRETTVLIVLAVYLRTMLRK
jgi:hypothetical protein